MSDAGSGDSLMSGTSGGAPGGRLPFAVITDRGVEVALSGDGAGAHGRLLVSEGSSGKSGAQVFAFPAGFCITWLERDSGGGLIKLRGVSPEGQLFGDEITIGEGACDNHSFSIGSFGWHPRLPGSEGGGCAAPGITISWVAASEAQSHYGRIVLQRLSVELDEQGNPCGFGLLPAAPVHDIEPASLVWSQSGGATANDNVIEIAGAGRDPAVRCMYTGDTLVAWVGTDQRIHGALVPAPEMADQPGGPDELLGGEYAALSKSLADLGPAAGQDAAHRRLQLLDVGSGSAALMWIALASSVEPRPTSDSLSDAGSADAATSGEASSQKVSAGLNGGFEYGTRNLDFTNELAADDERPAQTALSVDEPGEEGRAASQQGLQDGDPGHSPSRHGEFALGASPLHGQSGLAVDIAEFSRASGSGLAPELMADTSAGDRKSTPVPSIVTVSVAGTPGDDGVRATAPVVASTSGGAATIFEIANDDGRTVTLKIALQGAQSLSGSDEGAASPAEAVVSGQVDANVAPDIVGVGDGAAVAWVESSDAGSVLKIETFGSDAQPMSTVVVAATEPGCIASLDMAKQTVGPGSASGCTEQLAVVWVESTGNDGFGSVNVQRYGASNAAETGGQELIALGPDGTPEGDNGPLELTHADGTDVVGRDAKTAGLSDGDLAVVWVEKNGAEQETKETIGGVVLDQTSDGKCQAFYLDLTPLMPQGVADGTEPILMVGPGGDILVSWLEKSAAVRGAYDLKLATYDSLEAGGWLEPSTSITLAQYDFLPDDFDVALAGDGYSELFVTWREGSDLSGQRYALDGTLLGDPLVISKSGSSGVDTTATAGLVDGKVIVVYAEQDGRDVDVKATVVDFTSSGTGGSGDLASAPQAAPETEQSTLTADPAATTTQGEPVIIDAMGGLDGSLRIATINGLPVSSVDPVDTGSGFVQLRDDGKLLFTPDADFSGTATFYCTFTDGAGQQVQRIELSVDVLPDGAATAPLEEEYHFTYEGLTDAGLSDGPGTGGGDLLESGTEPMAAIGDYGDDTLVFKPGFGSDVITGFGASGEDHLVIDLSSYGYATFESLKNAGALMQDGDDVVITLTSPSMTTPDTLTLKSYSVSALVQDDFKFS